MAACRHASMRACVFWPGLPPSARRACAACGRTRSSTAHFEHIDLCPQLPHAFTIIHTPAFNEGPLRQESGFFAPSSLSLGLAFLWMASAAEQARMEAETLLETLGGDRLVRSLAEAAAAAEESGDGGASALDLEVRAPAACCSPLSVLLRNSGILPIMYTCQHVFPPVCNALGRST